MQLLAGVPGIAIGYTGGEPLSEWLRSQPRALADLLDVAIPLLQTLAEVHRRGVAHLNIRPDCVLVPPPPAQPLWTGFEGARACSAAHPAEPAGPGTAITPWLAPEQTGRSGRGVDARADLYAFGVMLYEWSTGRLPFEAADPLRLVHDILARVPTPPREAQPAVPYVLSDIVMRLLEKEPERRYQSAEGLRFDLACLREQLANGGEPSFPLGQHDFGDRLLPPPQPVGRVAELAQLRSALRDAAKGSFVSVLVTGEPGVGKSALVGQLRDALAARQGWFVAGRFDARRQDISASAVHQCFRALGGLLLAEPEAQLQSLRERMLRALGPNAGLFAGINPEFIQALGVAPQPSEDDPMLASQRLVRASVEVVRALAGTGRTLTMVLDDLQWAPPRSLAMVDALLTEPLLGGVLLVLVSRDVHAFPSHPLSAQLVRWHRLGVAPRPLPLAPLAPDALAQMLAAMLRLRPGPAAQLAALLQPRTGGNPLDTVELVNALRSDGLLTPGEEGWQWDAEAIRRHVASNEVIDLLEARLRRLPRPTRQLLALLACLGGEVSLDLLARLTGAPRRVARETLARAFDEGLLQTGESGERAVAFRHERIQRTAYGQLTQASRQRLHLLLARRLAAWPEHHSLAAEQYLPVVDVLREPAERERAARLLHRQATGDLQTQNPPLAERLLSSAAAVIADTPDLHGLRLPIAAARHAVLCNLGRLEEADAIYEEIIASGGEMLARVEPTCGQVASLANRGRLKEAVALGRQALGELGFAQPQRPREQAAADFVQAMVDVMAHATEDFERPLAQDPLVRAVGKLINRLMPPAHRCDRDAMAWLVTTALRLWRKQGPCAELVGPLAHVGHVAIVPGHDYRGRYELMRHLLAVGEARGFEPATSQARFLFGLGASHWFEPLERSVTNLLKAREGLLQGGDMQNACFTYVPTLVALRDCAATLAEYTAELDDAMAFGERTRNRMALRNFSSARWLADMLQRGEAEAEDAAAPPADDSVQLARYHTLLALHAALWGDSATLSTHAPLAVAAARDLRHFYSYSTTLLLQALSLADRMRAEPSGHTALQTEFDDIRAWMTRRAADEPSNFAHLVQWLAAERATFTGDRWAALRAYETALRDAAARQRPWHAALIAERAGRFHLAQGLEHSGLAWIAEARRRYAAWGADAKVRQLDKAHPRLPSVAAPHAPAEGGADAIDLQAILRASQALASETSLAQLQERVADLLAEMTGATRVRFALWDDELRQWRSADPGGDALPVSVLRSVQRTREPLRVDEVGQDDRFAADPCLVESRCRSLLAVPILLQGEVRAVLVLEHRLTRAAFGTGRLQAVQLIAGQLALSLVNLQPYESPELRVQDRTRE
jgi:predicted ATPase